MKAKMTDKVRLPNGEIIVLGVAIATGRATLSKSERLSAKNVLGYRTAYFADFPEFEGNLCVEIGKAAYEYRTTGTTELAENLATRIEAGELLSDKSMSDADFLAPLLGDSQ